MYWQSDHILCNTINERRNENISNEHEKENSTERENGGNTRQKNIDLTKLKSNLEISFTNKQNEYCTTKVISRAGEST